MNIRSDEPYPSNQLSNLAHHVFKVDDVLCSSMEGFLQSLKLEDEREQQRMCRMHGMDAKIKGRYGNDWMLYQQLWWKGDAILRGSGEYLNLLTKAFDRLSCNLHFMKALKATGEMKLFHNVGINDPRLTVITVDEFIGQLNRLRDEKCLGRSHETSNDAKSLF